VFSKTNHQVGEDIETLGFDWVVLDRVPYAIELLYKISSSCAEIAEALARDLDVVTARLLGLFLEAVEDVDRLLKFGDVDGTVRSLASANSYLANADTDGLHRLPVGRSRPSCRPFSWYPSIFRADRGKPCKVS
jgi:hypothetical protein